MAAATQQQGAGPGGAGRPPVVVFDWDCTITERHMFFCFENGAEDAWHHAQHFSVRPMPRVLRHRP